MPHGFSVCACHVGNGKPLGTCIGCAKHLPGVLPERKRDQKLSEVDHLLETFGKPPRLLTCECERSGSIRSSSRPNFIAVRK